MGSTHPKRAIVREPGKSFLKCISSHPLRDTINKSRAIKQHSKYCQVLSDLGLELIKLPAINYPDSCFVEDTVVIHNEKALITRMGALSRRGEEESIEKLLNEYLEVKKATAPATIEGGDVIHLEYQFICGITQRTNIDGINQMSEWLDIPVKICADPMIIHLKSYVTYLGNNTVITTKSYFDHPVFTSFEKLTVKDEERYAANTLTIGETVLMAKGYPNTHKMIITAGFDIITLEMSEFEKCEGALTCLSILF